MKKIDALFLEYGESPQNPTNKAIHWICVPLIFFSIVGLIASIPGGPLQNLTDGNPYANWATVLLILVIVYYVSLSIPLAIAMALFGLRSGPQGAGSPQRHVRRPCETWSPGARVNTFAQLCHRTRWATRLITAGVGPVDMYANLAQLCHRAMDRRRAAAGDTPRPN